jgi:protein-L-isoaspartate(D-aspartate) O-methyltransferase
MDFEQARFNMVEQQIRPYKVLDQHVLDLLFRVRREDFVPPAYRSLAFADLELPLPGGERMWAPKMEARVLQALQLARGESVLEIGTGSGYFTALLASRPAEVTTVEIDPQLAASAALKLVQHGFANVRREVGDGARGWGNGLYDAIVLTGSTPLLPEPSSSN